jgi:hypothetical protein
MCGLVGLFVLGLIPVIIVSLLWQTPIPVLGYYGAVMICFVLGVLWDSHTR